MTCNQRKVRAHWALRWLIILTLALSAHACGPVGGGSGGAGGAGGDGDFGAEDLATGNEVVHTANGGGEDDESALGDLMAGSRDRRDAAEPRDDSLADELASGHAVEHGQRHGSLSSGGGESESSQEQRQAWRTCVDSLRTDDNSAEQDDMNCCTANGRFIKYDGDDRNCP